MKKLIFLLVILSSCSNNYNNDDFKRYVFYDSHYPRPDFCPRFSDNEIDFSFYFSDFDYNIGSDQSDRNKILGISCNPDPHIDSYRLGWYYDTICKKVILSDYRYLNKERQPRTNIDTIDLYEQVDCRIVHEFGKVTYCLNRKSFEFEAKKDSSQRIYYIHKPYFGGNRTTKDSVILYLKS